MVLCTACTNSCLGTHFGYEQTPKSAWFIACEAVISGKGVLKPELVQRHPENSVILRGCELIELDDRGQDRPPSAPDTGDLGALLDRAGLREFTSSERS